MIFKKLSSEYQTEASVASKYEQLLKFDVTPLIQISYCENSELERKPNSCGLNNASF